MSFLAIICDLLFCICVFVVRTIPASIDYRDIVRPILALPSMLELLRSIAFEMKFRSYRSIRRDDQCRTVLSQYLLRTHRLCLMPRVMYQDSPTSKGS